MIALTDRFIYVKPIHLRQRFFDVISDPVDDVSGPIGFGHNTVERSPGFAQDSAASSPENSDPHRRYRAVKIGSG
jgi:hypothetical protein